MSDAAYVAVENTEDGPKVRAVFTDKLAAMKYASMRRDYVVEQVPVDPPEPPEGYVFSVWVRRDGQTIGDVDMYSERNVDPRDIERPERLFVPKGQAWTWVGPDRAYREVKAVVRVIVRAASPEAASARAKEIAAGFNGWDSKG